VLASLIDVLQTAFAEIRDGRYRTADEV